MEERKIKAWITRGGKHIPIFEDQTVPTPIFKKNLPAHKKRLEKAEKIANKSLDSQEEHIQRLKRAEERIKTDNSPEAQKELMNAKRTMLEARQRYTQRNAKYQALKRTSVIESYKFNKKKPSNEPDFQLAPEKEQKEFQAKYVNSTTELYRDKSSGWVIWVKRRNEGASLYPYYSSYEVWDEQGKPVLKLRGMKYNDAEIAKQAFEQAKEAVKRYKSPEPYKDILGPKREVKDPIAKLTQLHEENGINPNYKPDQTGNERYKWHKNCALCTASAVAQLWGYDVEAGPRDKNEWRGWETIMHLKDPKSKEHIDKLYNPMPSGPDAATNKLLKTVKSWGDNTYGELSVRWKHCNEPRAHSVLIVNQGATTNKHGSIYIIDFQSNTVYTDIHKYLSRTVCTKDEVHRLDNAVFKKGVEKQMEKMFKKKSSKSSSKQIDEAAGQIDWNKLERK